MKNRNNFWTTSLVLLTSIAAKNNMDNNVSAIKGIKYEGKTDTFQDYFHFGKFTL